MELTPLGIEGAWLAESPIWRDDRGFLREWFKSEDLKTATGRDLGIEQANISLSFTTQNKCLICCYLLSFSLSVGILFFRRS